MFAHAGLYAMTATLLIGIDPHLPFMEKWLALQWNASSFALAGALAVLSAWHRSPTFAVGSAMALSHALATSDWGIAFAEAHSLHQAATILLLVGVFTLLASCIYRRSHSRWIAFVAAFAMAAGVIHCFFPTLIPRSILRGATTLDYPLAAGLVTLGLIAIVTGWTHHYRLLVPGSIPLALAMITQRHHGWVWIAMSFIVLALGAVTSVRKSMVKGPVAMEGEVTSGAG
jgi:hypothetical protein